MKYELILAKFENIDLLIGYKLRNIFEYAINLTDEEVDKINNYVNSNIPKQIQNYKLITSDSKIIGCLLVEKHLDGVLLDEIYLDEEYRNKGIGTSIIKNILKDNNITYLWVYKNNKEAIRLYEKLGFTVIEETDSRYFMKFNKLDKARHFCQDVRELAKEYDLPFFVVTDGASSTSNNGCEAVKCARDNHRQWELENDFDPDEDWSN
jgi:ribosomal protein S18 acetylase RimI-like enzyme